MLVERFFWGKKAHTFPSQYLSSIIKIQQVVTASSVTTVQEYMEGGLILNRFQQIMPTQTLLSNRRKTHYYIYNSH